MSNSMFTHIGNLLKGKRASALEDYKRLLRIENPTAGDARALLEVMKVLDKSPDQARADARALREFAEQSIIASRLPDADRAYQDASAKVEPSFRSMERAKVIAEQAHRKVLAEQAAAMDNLQGHQQAARRVNVLKFEFAELLDGE